MVEPVSRVDSWRIRDVALDLPAVRREIRSSAVLLDIDRRPLPLSTNFNVDTCLARIRRDKSVTLRESFTAAASCIVASFSKKDDGNDDLESIDEEDLPRELKDISALEKLRSASMLRAHDNKDPSKRRSSDENHVALGGTLQGGPRGKTVKTNSTDPLPKFTRNTPASSAAALDSRLTNSRAILCTTANVVFSSLTPSLTKSAKDIEVIQIPQNPEIAMTESTDRQSNTIDFSKTGVVTNMGPIVVEAETIGNRIVAETRNASQRASRRFEYRRENAEFELRKSPSTVLDIPNPFALNCSNNEENEVGDADDDSHDDSNDNEERPSLLDDTTHSYEPNQDALTTTWTNRCLPRLKEISKTGVGHALYHDVEWRTRHGRIANLLQTLSMEEGCYGPHLIVSVTPDVERFAKEFHGVNTHLSLSGENKALQLRAIKYTGDKARRRRVRREFGLLAGTQDSPFHVILVSYTHFLQDFVHFCQVPFESVVIDDGASLLAAAHADPNGQIGRVWECAFFSKNDHQMGIAGTTLKDWDFQAEITSDMVPKDTLIGLTARRRLLTASSLYNTERPSDILPASGLVNFLLPYFAESVREEWDRSRIFNDPVSMKHFRRLLTRCVVIHDPSSFDQDIFQLAMKGMDGKLIVDNEIEDDVPEIIPDELFVQDGKVAQSRRFALQWLGVVENSWLRYELGSTSLELILNAMRTSNTYGHLCEEIVTASSTTTTGASGQVAGTLAYRLAVRCGRHFGSEQGLRQHIAAAHAPPGTWLCRTCGEDCVTSQARTTHERTCGQPNPFLEQMKIDKGSIGTTKSKKVRKQHGQPGVVGKKKSTKEVPITPSKKDADGSMQLPGYRGVWINQAGKHFVKVMGERYQDDDGEDVFFSSAEEAAQKYDDILKKESSVEANEYNFKSDGSRNIYDDHLSQAGAGLASGAASVVPALSVINIKDLPPDVKPLLRDPRQTSRAGGNSKRHIYAYRGVCRQARKGHDRWQSQISFCGVNHYLGTFDSEWDAAAIYSWAHLILYGEEATRQAQKEGEEAAAAYEKEKQDLAGGGAPIVPSMSMPEKKTIDKVSRKPTKEKNTNSEKPKQKRANDATNGQEKKKAKILLDKESLAPIFSKSASRATVLAPRNAFIGRTDVELAAEMAKRLQCVRDINYGALGKTAFESIVRDFRPCIPFSSSTQSSGAAMLLGLPSSLCGWSVESYLDKQQLPDSLTKEEVKDLLSSEFSSHGDNIQFKTLIQGTLTILGCASFRTQKVFLSLNVGSPPLGGPVGKIDCNVGGSPNACTETAAVIRFLPTEISDFQLSALSEDDMVTINGRRITPNLGSFPLFNEDICTIGPRVFVFILPQDA